MFLNTAGEWCIQFKLIFNVFWLRLFTCVGYNLNLPYFRAQSGKLIGLLGFCFAFSGAYGNLMCSFIINNGNILQVHTILLELRVLNLIEVLNLCKVLRLCEVLNRCEFYQIILMIFSGGS